MSGLAITGVGAVTSSGAGIESIEAALRGRATPPLDVDRSAGYHRPGASRRAYVASGVDLDGWVSPLAARRMCPASRYAVAAARQAAVGAGSEVLDDCAVILSTAYGAADVTERLLRQIILDGPEAASPALFTESVANAPAAQVALGLKARAANITITQRQAGPALALRRAAAELAAGRCAQIVVGAVDELNPILHAVLDRFGALARPDENGVEVARPFDARRSGFVAGEGAVVVFAERDPDEKRVIARATRTGCAFDPAAPRTSWPSDPARLVEVLRMSLGDELADIDLVVSGGSGSPAGDRFEGRLLRRLFDGSPPPVLAPKGILGEHGGAQLGGAIAVLGGASCGPTAGFAETDPEIGLTPYDGAPLAPPRKVLMTCLAAGGAAAWAVLERGR